MFVSLTFASSYFIVCQVSGLPTPDLTWLLNGKPVLPDGTHKMLVRETGVHSLLIDPLSQNDAGTYTCLATNKTGQNSFSLELTVVGKNHWKTTHSTAVIFRNPLPNLPTDKHKTIVNSLIVELLNGSVTAAGDKWTW